MLVGYAVVAALGAAYLFLLPAGTDDNEPTPVTEPTAPLMVALGDSFMSGEGAARYLPGTNTPQNRCHRATTAHPYLVAEHLGMRLVAATCSGATTADFDAAQHPESPRSTYGGVRQLEALEDPRIAPDAPVEPGTAALVMVGIGGNDADFGEIVKSCLDTDCRPTLQARTARLDTKVQQSLAKAYTDIRARVPDGARVLVMTYPQPVIAGGCVPGLTAAETRELTDRFLPRLNQIIRFQASRPDIGFEVVEVENAFVGARLCESAEPAMNKIVVQAGGGASSPSGSIHPNEKGHRILAAAVLAQLAQPTPESLPPSGPAMPPPPGGGPSPDGPSPDGPPPVAPAPDGSPSGEPVPTLAPPDPVALPPGSSVPVPASAPCVGGGGGGGGTMLLDNVRALTTEELAIAYEADPGSTACISVGSEDWLTTVVGEDGRLLVDTTRLNEARVSTIHVIREQDGALRSQVLTPPPDRLPAATAWSSRNSVWLGLAILSPLLIGLVVWWRSCRRAPAA